MTTPEKHKWWKDLDDYWKRYFKILLKPQLNFDREARNQFTPDEQDLDDLLNRDHLEIVNSSISSFKPLTAMPNLESLYCDAMPFMTSLEDLPLLSQLKVFRIGGSKITSFAPLSSMKNLLSLELYDNRVKTLDGIESLIQLKKLSLSEQGISDLTVLNKLTHLEYLKMSDMSIADFSTFTCMENLRTLHLYRMSVPSFAFLKMMPQLDELKFFRVFIISTKEIPVSPELRMLDLSDCIMEDLSPLASIPNLISLNITNTNARSLAPLAALKKLRELYINEDKFAPEEVKELKKELHQCEVYSERGKNFPFSRYDFYETLQEIESGGSYKETIPKGSKVIFTGYTYNHYYSIAMYFFRDMESKAGFTWTVHNQETKNPWEYFKKITI